LLLALPQSCVFEGLQSLISLIFTVVFSHTPLPPLLQPALISPQLSELTNSLANLKWGFRKRESELLGQIEQYKRMTVQLHSSQKRLRTSLR
jgi:hypothetical protein